MNSVNSLPAPAARRPFCFWQCWWPCPPFFACHVRYTDEEGQTQYGLSAVRQLRADQKAWAGPLDEAQLRRAIQANLDVRTSPDAQSEDVVRQDMAFHRQQAFEAIRDLLNSAYSEDFQAFDYFTADTLTPEDAPDFYANRVRLLQQWLEDNAFAFSQAEQNYLVQQYQALETPMYVDYTTGWQQFYEFSPTVIIILCLFACFLVSGIFSQEGQWKTDAIFFTTFHGRGRGVSAKVGAGLLLLTVLYWVPFLLFGESPWPSWGADRAGCPVQLYAWKSLYNLTLGQGGSSHCPGWISRHPVSGPAVHVGLRQERLHGAGRRAALRSDLPARPDAGGYQHLTQQHFGVAAR